MMKYNILSHAVAMVKRNLRGYGLLSVTIVLSFSLLLGFMGYMDTALYNKYKGLFMLNRGNVVVHEGQGTKAQFDSLLKKIAEVNDVRFYTYRSTGGTLATITGVRMESERGDMLRGISASLYFLSDHVWEFFYWMDEPVEIQWIDGAQHHEISLSADEAIIDFSTFQVLGLNRMKIPEFCFHIQSGQSGVLTKKVKIVGIIQQPGQLLTEEAGALAYNSAYTPCLLLSQKGLSLSELDQYAPTRNINLHSEQPEQIGMLLNSLGYNLGPTNSVYEQQNTALEKIQTQKATKAVIAGALLIILGINLYSCFTNALNDRKFEIGVKRAIGASTGQIVRQFLYESITVMVVNILLSVSIVLNLGLVFKLIVEHIHKNDPTVWLQYWDYILYISPYSV